jgi:hypothetical protein
VRDRAPFQADDLAGLDELLSAASAVVALIDVHRGNRSPSVIGLRHDCDAAHSLATAVKMAEWEAERGYRSTYYLLHTSPYWGAPGFRESLDRIACLGHEIGIHSDALAEALKTGGDPDAILEDALAELRGYGFQVLGVAGHGNRLCVRDRGVGEAEFFNRDQFTGCGGVHGREITRGAHTIRVRPRPLADFGLEYEALSAGSLPPWRQSDSGGRWYRNPDELLAEFAANTEKQLHLLQHPDHWREAFTREAVAA